MSKAKIRRYFKSDTNKDNDYTDDFNINTEYHNKLDLAIKSMEKLVIVNFEQSEEIKNIKAELDLIKKELNATKSAIELCRLNSDAKNDLYDYMMYVKDQLLNDTPLNQKNISSLTEKYNQKKICQRTATSPIYG